jgi:hypothetical protein
MGEGAWGDNHSGERGSAVVGGGARDDDELLRAAREPGAEAEVGAVVPRVVLEEADRPPGHHPDPLSAHRLRVDRAEEPAHSAQIEERDLGEVANAARPPLPLARVLRSVR